MTDLACIKDFTDEELRNVTAKIEKELELRKEEGQFEYEKLGSASFRYYFDPVIGKVGLCNELNEARAPNLTMRRTAYAAERDKELWELTTTVERRIASLNREQNRQADSDDLWQRKFLLGYDPKEKWVYKEVTPVARVANPTKHFMTIATADQILKEFSAVQIKAFVTQEWVNWDEQVGVKND